MVDLPLPPQAVRNLARESQPSSSAARNDGGSGPPRKTGRSFSCSSFTASSPQANMRVSVPSVLASSNDGEVGPSQRSGSRSTCEGFATSAALSSRAAPTQGALAIRRKLRRSGKGYSFDYGLLDARVECVKGPAGVFSIHVRNMLYTLSIVQLPPQAHMTKQVTASS